VTTNNCSIVLQPLSQSNQSKSVSLPSLNYTNQDFSSMKARLVNFIQQQYPNDFNDFVEGDLGIMLIENWAFLADTLSFKTDQMVNELFIDTVTELDNAFRLCKLVGFYPTPPIAASAMFQASITQLLSVDLVITGGLQLSIANAGQPLTYELFPADANNNAILDQDIIIPAGSFNNSSIIGLEGTTIIETFTSDGSINQTITLSTNPVLFDSVFVDVDGVRWTEVDFFTDSNPRQEYRVEFDATWTGYIVFGNSQAGLIPSNGSQITVTYRTGGGTIGNIVTGSISQQLGVSVPGFANIIPVSFTNYTAGDFGYGGDTIDTIRIKLPAFINTQNRAVTGDDYKTLTEQFVTPYNGQVGKATAVLRNTGCAGNIVDLYILTLTGDNGLELANDQLKSELSDYIDTVKMITDFVCIKDGVIILVDTIIDITIPKIYKKFNDQLTTRIQNDINTFFSLNNWDYGENLKDSDIIKALSDIQEISSIDVSFTTNDPGNAGTLVVADYYEIITQDTTTFNITYE
jgi:hypothetical protein